jgi:hypothetical protein
MRRFLISLAIIILLPLTALAATVTLQPISDSESNNRWMDIADNTYSSDYQNVFTYGPSVTLTYNSTSGTFSGTLTATGLKPNFAYQMKLGGDPEIDDWTNEQLGNAGRWWDEQGYLIFDFFVTNELGNASVSFSADSSYHVLWKTTQRLQRPNDGPLISTTFDPNTSSPAYDFDYSQKTIIIYGEWQTGRALPGELTLPAGDYCASFVLTEESFHQSNVEGGGNWASVLAGDVNFTVVPIPGTAFLLGTALLSLLGIRRRI